MRRYALAIAAAAALLAGCGTQSTMPQPTSPTLPSRDARLGKIRHVVIIVQEDRSFNNLFYGLPGAKTVGYGYNEAGKRIALKPVTLATSWAITTGAAAFVAACNGKRKYPRTQCRMNGFDNEYWSCGHPASDPCPNKNPPYSYAPRSETKPYFFIGEHYVAADQMYASNFDGSEFVAGQYLIAGQADRSVGFPTTWWGCPARRSWAYYTSAYDGDGGIWNAYQNIEEIYDGPGWTTNVISPQTTFFSDVGKASAERGSALSGMPVKLYNSVSGPEVVMLKIVPQASLLLAHEPSNGDQPCADFCSKSNSRRVDRLKPRKPC